MRFKDYYKTLGVATDADGDAIKSAYRALARKHHPDVSTESGAEKRFTEIGEAYEALQDPTRRAAYDRLRAGGMQDGQEIDPTRYADDHRGYDRGDFAGADHFGDFFHSLFGRQERDARSSAHGAFRQRGSDLHYSLTVTLEESFHGGERELMLQTPSLGSPTSDSRSITVKIPPGVVHGTSIRLRGQGRAGSDAGAAGDLYLDIVLAPHRLFQVDGHDLSLVVPIAPWEAVLGAQIEVPTLGGTVTATVPAGTMNGQKLRLKGRGLPGDPPGDQYLELSVVVPASNSDAVKALYRDLARESSFQPRRTLGV